MNHSYSYGVAAHSAAELKLPDRLATKIMNTASYSFRIDPCIIASNSDRLHRSVRQLH